MHRKEKGNIGETAVALDLMKQGYAVFTELGDLSKVDLIALKDDKVLRIQVKARSSENGKVCIQSVKSAKGYKYKYAKNDFDYIAIYALDEDKIAYVSSHEFCAYRSMMTLRFQAALNNNNKKVNYFSDYRYIK